MNFAHLQTETGIGALFPGVAETFPNHVKFQTKTLPPSRIESFRLSADN